MIAAGRKILSTIRVRYRNRLELANSQSLKEHAKRLGKLLGWSGPLMIEFMRDARPKKFKIIEVNTILWLFHDFIANTVSTLLVLQFASIMTFNLEQNYLNPVIDGRALVEPDKMYYETEK